MYRNNNNNSLILDLSEENLSKTHTKTETPVEGHWFEDLDGNPLWILPNVFTVWKPKS